MKAQLRGSTQIFIADCAVAWNTYKRNAGIAQVEPPPHTPTPQFILPLQRMRGINKKISGTFTARSPKRKTETTAAAFQPGSLRHVVRCRTRPNWLPFVICICRNRSRPCQAVFAPLAGTINRSNGTTGKIMPSKPDADILNTSHYNRIGCETSKAVGNTPPKV